MAQLCKLLILISGVCIVPISSLIAWRSGSTALPSHLSLSASATINEETIYLFGGFNDDTNTPSHKIYKYAINSGLWITLPITTPSSLPIYCYQCTAILNQTLIYIVTHNINTILIFDTTNDIFLSSDHISPPLSPINGSYISVTNDSFGEYMFVVSYQQSGPHSIAYLQRYNYYTNEWFPSRPFPFPSHGFTGSIFHNSILFVFAGHVKNCNNANADKCKISNHDRICGYDITTHSWSCYKATLNENKYGAAIVMDRNGKIYIIAGWRDADNIINDNAYSNTVDIFDPNTFICSQIESLPDIGGLVIPSMLNQQLIVFGGRNLSSSSLQNVYTSLVLQNITPLPTVTPSESPSSNPSNPSNNPRITPSGNPSYFPSLSPSNTPSFIPTNHPTDEPSISPSKTPTISPSNMPTKYPSVHPTNIPSQSPSNTPSSIPTISPSNTPSFTPTDGPTNEPSIFPSNNPTANPTINPTIYPSNIPIQLPTQNTIIIPTYKPSQTLSNAPTLYPIIDPTVTPSISPTISPSTMPTQLPSKNPSNAQLNYLSSPPFVSTNESTQDSVSKSPKETATNHPAKPPKQTNTNQVETNQTLLPLSNTNTTNVAIHTLSAHYNTLLISGTTSLILFISCCIYLCIFTSKRTREIGQMEWTDFMKHASMLLKIGLLLEITDIFTDFMYAIYLINYNTIQIQTFHSIETLAWMSLLCGVLGSLLFVFELMLARKLYSKIPVLREKLNVFSKFHMDHHDLSYDASHNDIIREIRTRRVDIDIFAILIACFQDIPQITIIIIATAMLNKWTQFSILSLMISIVSCTLKCLKVIVDLFGCGDAVIQPVGYEEVDKYDHNASNSMVSLGSITVNQKEAKYRKKIKFKKILNAEGMDEYNEDSDTNNILSEDSLKSNSHSLDLINESDEEEDDEEKNEDADEQKKKSKNRRPLRISRRATFQKHKLLMIPEETDDAEWSEFDMK